MKTAVARILVVFWIFAISPAEGSWHFCRLKHDGAWDNDHPDAEQNLLAMLEGVTFIDAFSTTLVVSPTEEDLSQCAFVLASNVDKLSWTDDEAAIVGDWLRKGGFLWTDGFWKDEAWENWNQQLRKALPKAQIRELHSHSIFEYPFQVQLRQSCLNGGWVKNFAVEDEEERLMVLMTLNERRGKKAQCGAVGDAWEGYAANWQREEAAWRFSVNVFLYIMTH